MVRLPIAVLVCAAALSLGGCGASKFNPFTEKDPVIPGERRPVFETGSGFEGPRKLPPPNSDYVGATMRADEPVPPPQPAAAAPETAPGVVTGPAAGSSASSAPQASSPGVRREPLPVPPPPQ